MLRKVFPTFCLRSLPHGKVTNTCYKEREEVYAGQRNRVGVILGSSGGQHSPALLSPPTGPPPSATWTYRKRGSPCGRWDQRRLAALRCALRWGGPEQVTQIGSRPQVEKTEADKLATATDSPNRARHN